MGINYSVSFGYGFAVDESELPEPFTGMDSYDIADWFKENGYTEIGVEWAGNLMADPTYAFVYAKSTYVHEDLYNFDGVYDVGENPNTKALLELSSAAKLLEYTGTIGAKVIGNVS